MSRSTITILVGLAISLVSTALAAAHFTTDDRRVENQPTHVRGTFFFDGTLFAGRDPASDAPKDPINLVFAYGCYEGNCNVHSGTVGRALDDNWRSRYENRMRKERICQSTLYNIWTNWSSDRREGAPFEDPEGQDFQRTATHPGCYDQYHIRGYEDYYHQKGTRSHGGFDRYLLAGLHHETRRGIFAGHTPDRDWDKVRVEGIKAMCEHGTTRRYLYHPSNERTYQGFTNSGFLGIVNMRLDGCKRGE